MKNVLSSQQKYFSAIALLLLTTPVTLASAQIPGVLGTQESQPKQVPIGDSVEGTITAPIIWTDNWRSSATQATISLNEPLLYSDGTIALPKDSSLIVEVSDFNRAGFVTLNAIAINYKHLRGESHQHLIPENTLLIRSRNNYPLEFEIESNEENSIVGGLINEAVQTGTRNLSLPSGLDSAVSRTIRDNFRASRRSNSNAVYLIREETEVSIYVNSFFTIED